MYYILLKVLRTTSEPQTLDVESHVTDTLSVTQFDMILVGGCKLLAPESKNSEPQCDNFHH